MMSDKEKTIKIKTSWSDVTIQDYMDIVNIMSSTVLQDVDKFVNVISILSGEDTETISEIPIPVYNQLLNKIDFINEQVVPNKKFRPLMNLNGLDYFINLEIGKMKTWQYIDIITLSSDESAELMDNLHKILARFIYPVRVKKNILGVRKQEPITGFEVEDVEDIILKHMKITDALAVFDFFLNSFMRIIDHTKTSLMLEMKKMRLRMKVLKFFKRPIPQTVLDGYAQSLTLHEQLDGLGMLFTKSTLPSSLTRLRSSKKKDLEKEKK